MNLIKNAEGKAMCALCGELLTPRQALKCREHYSRDWIELRQNIVVCNQRNQTLEELIKNLSSVAANNLAEAQRMRTALLKFGPRAHDSACPAGDFPEGMECECGSDKHNHDLMEAMKGNTP